MMALIVICGLATLAALLGIVFTVTSGLLTSGVDGLFVLLVCLLMMAVFGSQLLRLAQQANLVPTKPLRLRRRTPQPAQEEIASPRDLAVGGKR